MTSRSEGAAELAEVLSFQSFRVSNAVFFNTCSRRFTSGYFLKASADAGKMVMFRNA
jgi:hypothetical protein